MDGADSGRCEQCFTVRSDAHGAEHAPRQLAYFLARSDIPYADRAVRLGKSTARDQYLAVFRKSQGANISLVAAEDAQFFAGLRIPKSNELVGAAGGQHFAIRRKPTE